MKITHLIESQAAVYGGPAVSVPWLALACRDAGHAVDIISVDEGNANNQLIGDLGLVWKRVRPQGPLSARFSSGLEREIRASRPDLLHLHNLWNYVSFSAHRYCSKHGVPLVISPRSGLYASSLHKGKLKKSIALAAFQRRAISAAHCIHATSLEELKEVRDFGYRGPVAVIPNLLRSLPFASTIREGGEIVFLCMSRLHPRKNIDKMIEGFALFTQRSTVSARLNIVGPSEKDFIDAMKQLARESGQASRIEFHPMAIGAEKELHFHSSDAFILVSKFENFGMSIAEALSAGLPVICSRGTPWHDIEEFGAGYCIEPDPLVLAETLDRLSRELIEGKTKLSNRAKTYFEHRVDSERIAKDYSRFYDWLVHGGSTPHFVETA